MDPDAAHGLTDSARLLAVEDIKALKARYFRTMDTKDWESFGDQFSEQAVLDVSGEMQDPGLDPDTAGDAEPGIVRGRAAIVEFVRSAIDAVTTVHHGHMPEIDVTSPMSAIGVWAMEDTLTWPPGAPITSMHGFGHYYETYEKRVEGGSAEPRWRIASTRLVRLRVDVQMREPAD